MFIFLKSRFGSPSSKLKLYLKIRRDPVRMFDFCHDREEDMLVII